MTMLVFIRNTIYGHQARFNEITIPIKELVVLQATFKVDRFGRIYEIYLFIHICSETI
jgi:hypothetical protein